MSDDHEDQQTPITDVRESDPNADSAEGLAGGMGVSSERVGPQRGSEPNTHGADGSWQGQDEEYAEGEEPPEKSADPATGEPNPDPPAQTNRAGYLSKPGPGL